MSGERASEWLGDLAGRVLPELVESLGAGARGEPQVGERLGTYRLESVLGRGGMGVVFAAHDERLGRDVALKFLTPRGGESRSSRERALAEARAAARLDHPGIAVVHEVGEADDGRPFIVMTRYEGETLAARIAREPVGIEHAAEIARQVADALAAAHGAGIVHRDIKPGNIILTDDGRVKIVDFGIAGRVDLDGESTAMAGTAPYMSPEQALGQSADTRSDVWSVGAVLYELLAGVRPFRGETRAEVLAAVEEGSPAPLGASRPDVPEPLAQVVARCLEPRREDRFDSAAELLDALVALVPEWPQGAGTRHRERAEHLYQKGRRMLEGGDRDSAAQARDHFVAALNEDPGSARAWSGLSDAFETLAYVSALPPDEAHLRARAAAERAIDLDPDLAEAHVSMATVLVDYYRDWETAERHYTRAIELDPDYPVGRQLYAEFLRDRGRFDEAMEQIDKAIELDPLSPFFRLVRGIVLRMSRRYEEALEVFDQLLEVAPDYSPAHFYSAITCAVVGKHHQALDALDLMDADRTNPDSLCIEGIVHAFAGRRELAERALRALDGPHPGYHVLPFHRGLIHLALGEVDSALTRFEEGAELRSWFTRILRVEPLLDPVRDHPRFQALVANILA